jgi:ferredoxin--NADP+ reductase
MIDPDTCIDCGACAPECPVDCIYPDDEVPEEYEEWIDKNRAFFEEGPGYSAA